MKIFINRKIVEGPWGGGNKFVKALFKNAAELGHQVVNTLDSDIDIIHIHDVHSDSLGVDANVCLRYKHEHNPSVKIVHRVNDMDLGRYGAVPWRDNAYIHFSEYFDASIFVSDWTKQFFLNKGWKGRNNHVATNGIDKEIFYPSEKIKNDKINIVTHHWSANEGKGFAIYEKIDDFVKTNPKFVLTYIGRDRGTFKNSVVVSPIHGHELGRELAKHDVYISASEYENCPNHILESLACKIPTYACLEGGASVGLVGKDHVFKNWDHLKEILYSRDYVMNNYDPPSWREAITEYCKIYEKILGA